MATVTNLKQQVISVPSVTKTQGSTLYSYTSPSTRITFNAFTTNALTNNTGITISYRVSSNNGGVATVTKGTGNRDNLVDITVTTPGDFILTGSSPKNNNWTAASNSIKFVCKRQQTISATLNLGPYTCGTTTTIPVATATSGLPVTITVTNGSGQATVNSATRLLSLRKLGTIKVNYTQSGNNQFHAAPTRISTDITIASPATITRTFTLQYQTGGRTPFKTFDLAAQIKNQFAEFRNANLTDFRPEPTQVGFIKLGYVVEKCTGRTCTESVELIAQKPSTVKIEYPGARWLGSTTFQNAYKVNLYLRDNPSLGETERFALLNPKGEFCTYNIAKPIYVSSFNSVGIQGVVWRLRCVNASNCDQVIIFNVKVNYI
jgi:hypothetical protein